MKTEATAELGLLYDWIIPVMVFALLSDRKRTVRP